MNDLVMLIGLPGCGKSTYRAPYGDAVLSTDDYIEAFAAENKSTYNAVFEQYVKTAEEAMFIRMLGLIRDRDIVPTVIWDQTNLTAKTRKKKLDRFNKYGGSDYRKIALCFEPDLNLSIIRNEERRAFGRGVPLHVIESMNNQFETPSKSEGFDYIFISPSMS